MSVTTNPLDYIWETCLERLQGELPDAHFNMWIRPLQFSVDKDNNWMLFAPNQFVKDWVHMEYFSKINEIFYDITGKEQELVIKIGSKSANTPVNKVAETAVTEIPKEEPKKRRQTYSISLNPEFSFDNFVIFAYLALADVLFKKFIDV